MSEKLFDIDAFRAQPLPTEESIIDAWGGDLEFKVTVCCICFNHEKYILDTLQGFFSQITNFPFKVLIYDDLSTDKSRYKIIKKKKKYPKIIDIVFPDENQHSKGNRPLYFLFPKVNTEYLAMCEGDDYWCSSSKLQRQFDALEKNKQFNICCHPSFTLLNGELFDRDYGKLKGKNEAIKVEKVIEVSGGLIPMASMFIRSNALTKYSLEYPELYQKYLRHSAIQIISCLPNGVLYLDETMSVYRSMHEGSWSYRNKHDATERLNNYMEFVKRNRNIKKITEHKYDHLFNKVMKRRIYSLVSSPDISFIESLYSYFELVKLPLKVSDKLFGFICVFLGVVKRLIFKFK